MKIFNVRAGFATNSSSSHSIVMIPEGLRVSTREYYRFKYGWEEFTLADRESKSAYFATQLYGSLTQHHYLDEQTAVNLVNSWCNTEYQTEDLDGSYVDHQSVWGFNQENLLDTNLVQAMHEFVMRPDVVILGGNDNSDGQTPPPGSWQNELTEAIGDRGYVRARQDGEYWAMFNNWNGNKIRFSVNDAAPEYVKSSLPELVDLKITDQCPYQCAFCFVPGTPILTPMGMTPIEELRAGDKVMVFDLDKNQIEVSPIAETYARQYSGDLFEIELEDGRSITLTPNHEVYIKGRGWIPADECEENDEILDIKEAR